MGKEETYMIIGNLNLILLVSHAPTNMDTIDNTPNGMLNKIDWNELNPKPCMIKGPKAPIPPLGSAAKKRSMNHKYVFKSLKVSKN